MCQVCEISKLYDMQADIKCRTTIWVEDKQTETMKLEDSWTGLLFNIPVRYCPECGRKLI